MRRAFTLSLGFALAFGLFSGEAVAKSRKQASAAQSGNAIPLPNNLTTDKDWLDDGAGDPASGTLQPNAHNNDNYFVQQRNGYDPTWYTEMGTIFDGN